MKMSENFVPFIIFILVFSSIFICRAENNKDFTFRTYSYVEGEPSAVGGDIFTIDKMAVLTPHLLVAIVILTTTTVFIKKRKH